MLRETHAINLVRALTSIPVPNVRQLVVSPAQFGLENTYIVMDYIEGETLDECWSKLGFLTKLKVVWKLRNYVSQLKRVRATIPGPVDGSECIGFYFTETGAGPFSTYEDMIAWFNHKLEVNKRWKQPPPHARSFDTSWPLVFTHQDLCPRNIILSKDGTLYIVDWAWAGFYPAWFEYAGMRRYDNLPASWRFFIPFISGRESPSYMLRLAH